jgi:hypothetical protein
VTWPGRLPSWCGAPRRTRVFTFRLVTFDLVTFDLVTFDLVTFDLVTFDLVTFDLVTTDDFPPLWRTGECDHDHGRPERHREHPRAADRPRRLLGERPGHPRDPRFDRVGQIRVPPPRPAPAPG